MQNVASTEQGFASLRASDSNSDGKKNIDYTGLVDGMRAQFASNKTKSLEWRKRQLRKFCEMIKAHHAEFSGAVTKDHRGPKIRGFFDVAGAFEEANDAIKYLDSWTKPVSVKHSSFLGRSEIRYEPKGVILVISPWNYPIDLALRPIVSAIAAGNCVVLKPSEVSVNSSQVLERYIHQYMDTSCIRVVQGAVPETTALLEQKWDHIMYTGNGAVARIVMAAASKHLTPCTLELGGKSPVIIDKSARVDTAVARIAFGKWTNSGQTCIAPDYILVHKDVKQEFVTKMTALLKKHYGSNPQNSKDWGRIISPRHVGRVGRLLKTTTAKSVTGGVDTIDANDNYIAPTILDEPSLNDKVMSEEIFGPLLPVLSVNSMDEAIERVNTICDKPLALYIFAEDTKVVDDILSRTQSGGVCVNSTFEHIMNKNLPFGGVGESGMGAYHGKFGFDEFSHKRSTFYADTFVNRGAVLAPPFKDSLYDLLVKLQITGFLSDSQKNAIKGGVVALAALALWKKFGSNRSRL